MQASGVKCVIRFAYYKPSVWPDPSPPDKTEPDLARIRLHIAALTPVLKAWTHAIIAVQNGIIGPWGEGHGSTHFSCDASNGGKRQIINDLLAAVPGRMVQVRYPSLKPQLWYPDEEASMSIIAGASNLVVNSDMETDNGGNAPANFFVWVGTGSPSIELTSAESISGSSAKVYAGFGAAQVIQLDSTQGIYKPAVSLFYFTALHIAQYYFSSVNRCFGEHHQDIWQQQALRRCHARCRIGLFHLYRYNIH